MRVTERALKLTREGKVCAHFTLSADLRVQERFLTTVRL